MSFPSLSSLTVNCEKLENLELLIARNLAGLLLRPINLPLFFKRRVEKKKFEDVFAFPEEKEQERQMVGTAGRRLLSDLCFYFSFEVISFYSIFHITCFLKTGGGLSSR